MLTNGLFGSLESLLFFFFSLLHFFSCVKKSVFYILKPQAGVAQPVERHLPKVNVVSSSLIARLRLSARAMTQKSVNRAAIMRV